ncbi:MAG: transcriptional regulator [Aerococcaceae bacterium]|nr:transcriptional regulator [Aerococcaceae bacterium]
MISKVLFYRKAIKLNQKEVANYLGISVDGYAKKERGETEFKASEMENFFQLVKKEIPSAKVEDIFFS